MKEIPEKDKIMSVIANELKAPVGNFRVVVDILLKHFGSVNEKNLGDLLIMLKESASSSYYLLENLYDWANYQKGCADFKPIVFDINKLVHESLNLLTMQAQNKEISLHFVPNAKKTVYADMDMASSILRNLVSNAIKYTNRGGEVYIETRDTNTMVHVSVKDEGIGICPGKKAMIFNIHNQQTTPGTENENGSGLGLPLCKAFVEKNKGEIGVDSKNGVGSVFYFALPSAMRKA